MARTRHMEARMSQRGINQEMLDLTLRFGTPKGDRIILNRKGTEAVIRELDALRGKLLKVLDKGGLVVVEEGGSLITAYRVDTFRPGKAVGQSPCDGPPADSPSHLTTLTEDLSL